MSEYNCPQNDCEYSGTWLGLVNHYRQAHDDELDKSPYLLEEIHRLHNELSEVPKQEDMTKYGDFGESSYQYEFGGWNNGLQEAGLPVNLNRDVSNTELIEELQQLRDELGRAPYEHEMSNLSTFGRGTYEKHFGSWNDALIAAGLELNHDWSERELDEKKLVEWKKNVKKRDSFTCQDCGSTQNLQSHHIKKKKNHPELAFDVDNGVTVCVSCHAERHSGEACYSLLRGQAKALSSDSANSEP